MTIRTIPTVKRGMFKLELFIFSLLSDSLMGESVHAFCFHKFHLATDKGKETSNKTNVHHNCPKIFLIPDLDIESDASKVRADNTPQALCSVAHVYGQFLLEGCPAWVRPERAVESGAFAKQGAA
jgi:hypothetical protein